MPNDDQLIGVFDPSDEHTLMAERTRLVRDLRGGTPAMWLAGTRWLPAFPKEGSTSKLDGKYQKRLRNTTLYNMYEHALANHAGRVFAEPVHLADDMPEPLVDWTENVDSYGSSLQSWAPMVYTSGEDDGITFCFVDAPENPSNNAAEMQGQPYLVHLTCDDLLDANHEKTADGYRFTMIRFRDDTVERRGRYDRDCIERVRVVDLDPPEDLEWEGGFLPMGMPRWELWRRTDDDESETLEAAAPWTLTKDGMPWLPFHRFPTRADGAITGRPFNEDLAYKNLEHWRLTSVVNNYRENVLIPFRKFIGIPREDFLAIKDNGIGSDLVLHTEQPASGVDVGVVEGDMTSLQEGRLELERLKEEGADLGRRPMMKQSSGSRTATEHAIKSAESHGDIQQCALRFAEFLSEVFVSVGLYLNQTVPMPAVSIEGDLTIDDDPEDMNAVLAVVDALEGRPEEVQRMILSEAKRRDVLSEDVDVNRLVAASEGSMGDRGMAAAAAQLRLVQGQMGQPPLPDDEPEPAA